MAFLFAIFIECTGVSYGNKEGLSYNVTIVPYLYILLDYFALGRCVFCNQAKDITYGRNQYNAVVTAEFFTSAYTA